MFMQALTVEQFVFKYLRRLSQQPCLSPGRTVENACGKWMWQLGFTFWPEQTIYLRKIAIYLQLLGYRLIFITKMTSEQRPPVTNGHYFEVSKVVVVRRFDCILEVPLRREPTKTKCHCVRTSARPGGMF